MNARYKAFWKMKVFSKYSIKSIKISQRSQTSSPPASSGRHGSRFSLVPSWGHELTSYLNLLISYFCDYKSTTDLSHRRSQWFSLLPDSTQRTTWESNTFSFSLEPLQGQHHIHSWRTRWRCRESNSQCLGFSSVPFRKTGHLLFSVPCLILIFSWKNAFLKLLSILFLEGTKERIPAPTMLLTAQYIMQQM